MRSRLSSSKKRDLLGRVNTPGELLSLIRAGTAVTRADLARHTGLARSTVAQRVDALLAGGLVLEAGDTPSTGGRPATMLAFNHQAGRGARGRPGRHPRAHGPDRPGRHAARRAGRGSRHRARAGRGADVGVGPLRRAASDDREGRRRPPRDRHRRAGPGGVRHRPAGQSADHARLGWLRHPGLVRGALPRTRARGQRREHHGPRRALGSLARHPPPPAREGRDGHRLRDRRGRAHPPRRARSRRGHRPHPGHRRGRDLRVRQHRLPRGGCRRARPRDAARGLRNRGVEQPRCRPAGARGQCHARPRWCGRRGAPWARFSPAR